MSKEIFAYKLGKINGVNPRDILNIHFDHAKKNDNKVLFTIEKKKINIPAIDWHKDLKEVIIFVEEYNEVLHGSIVNIEISGLQDYKINHNDNYNIYTLPEDYLDEYNTNIERTIIAIEDVKRITVDRGMYYTDPVEKQNEPKDFYEVINSNESKLNYFLKK